MLTWSNDLRHVVAWLPAVRWSTSVALWAVLAAAWLLPELDLPIRAIALIGLAAAICRTLVAVAHRRSHHPPRWLSGLSWAADAALLTGLLDITGGPFNPFIVIYVAYVWLAGATVSAGWGVLVAVVSAMGFGWLVFDHLQVGLIEHHRLSDFPTHLFTMWFTGAALAELVAHYVTRARVVLAQRQELLDEARDRAARSERLASLTTLAAGAAHELSTPLATIAVAARELERNSGHLSERTSIVATVADDARLIRSEVSRCQAILDGMTGRASDGGLSAEALAPCAIVELAKSRLPDDRQRRLRLEMAPDTSAPAAGGSEVAQALSSLLKNAFDASSESDEIVLRIAQHGGMLRFEVIDRGVGMDPESRRRAGDPFYTTKAPGSGLGLGLFLARTIAERSGGSLQFAFAGERGTTAILEIPVTIAEEEHA